MPQNNLEQQEPIQLNFSGYVLFWISFDCFSTRVKQMLMTTLFLMHLGEMLSKKCSAQEEWAGQPNIAGSGQPKSADSIPAWHQLHHEVWRQRCGGCENPWKSKGSWTNEIQIFLLVLATEKGVDLSAVRCGQVVFLYHTHHPWAVWIQREKLGTLFWQSFSGSGLFGV